MIDGFKIKITSSELKKHCQEKSAYHSKRAEEKNQELPTIKDALEKIKTIGPAQSVSHMNKGSYHLDPGDAVEQLETDIRDHHNKSLVFAFFAEHLFDEDYVLDETALIRLEIIKRW
jgi:hypothetical protein